VSNRSQKPVTVLLVIALQFLLGLGAFISGGMLMAFPDGSLLQMPTSMLQYSPFRDFLIPGMILFALLGVFPLAVAYSLWQKPAWRWPNLLNPFKRQHWAWAASLAAGVIVILWITVQVLLLRTVAFLHILYFIWGWAIIGLTLSPKTRRHYLL
jgi:hypothetical protein